MPTYKGSINLLGLEVPIEVDYKIINYGSSPSYSPMYGADEGDAPEIYILSITKQSNDEDITKFCCEQRTFRECRFAEGMVIDKNWQDLIRREMFGLPRGYASKLQKYNRKPTIEDWRGSLYEEIENEILSSKDFGDDRFEYD